jgi:type VI secretion system protein ImpA
LIDFEAILRPIPGDRPAGVPVPFDVRTQLENARKEEDPDEYAPDDPRRPEKRINADWAGIVNLARKVLTEQSKDLQIAARLTEALVKLNGFAGLRDGMHLLRLLVEQCWDRLQPEVEGPDDLEVRGSAFAWLDDADHGARFPATLRMIPLVADDSGAYGWLQWRQGQDGKGSVTRAVLDQAIQVTPRERIQDVVDDLARASQDLVACRQVLAEKIGQAAPGLTNLQQAVAECQTLAVQMLQRKGPAPGAASPGPAADGAASPAAPSRPVTTRDEAYRRLAEVAAVLRELEPHSPIPYFIQRAVQLGAMPFPKLMNELIRDANVLAELSRELGIKEPSPAPPPPPG